jgi:hypothetical protein
MIDVHEGHHAIAPSKPSRENREAGEDPALPHRPVRRVPAQAEFNQDGDGTLLDHSLILYGSNMSNSNQHNHFRCRISSSAAAGNHKGGRHLKLTRITRR